MGIIVGVVGVGQFALQFIPLFKLHPDVDAVYATDIVPERAADAVSGLGVDRVFASYEDLLSSDCDAVAIFTQRWTHGPLVLQALNAGKHAYSTVPMAISTEEISAIVSAVDKTGRTYMMGETSYYYPGPV